MTTLEAVPRLWKLRIIVAGHAVAIYSTTEPEAEVMIGHRPVPFFGGAAPGMRVAELRWTTLQPHVVASIDLDAVQAVEWAELSPQAAQQIRKAFQLADRSDKT